MDINTKEVIEMALEFGFMLGMAWINRGNIYSAVTRRDSLGAKHVGINTGSSGSESTEQHGEL